MSNELIQIKEFEGSPIRSILYNNQVYFAIVDIVHVLIQSKNPRRYWSDLKRKLKREGFIEVYENIVQLKLKAPDGKLRVTDCANLKTILRIIQSIPSPKAEPIKRFLSQAGSDKIEEIENPEILVRRLEEYYQSLGYDEHWIKQRIRSHFVRKQLTDEWSKRGVRVGREYAILTAVISQGIFGVKPSEHKVLKSLAKADNLRDHMSNLELIFTMLGEETTRQEAIKLDAQGFPQNRDAAKYGGQIAGDTLKTYEEKSGNKVLNEQNYKSQIKEAKKKNKLS